MKRLMHMVLWDLKLANRHQVISVTLFLAISYIIILFYFRHDPIKELLILMIFSDPVMLGFMFIGAMVLFEKNANTLSAIAVSPLRIWQYLWSKGIVFTLIAILISIAIIIAGYSGQIHFVYLIFSVSITSMLFVFMGIIGVIRVKTFNQYILVIPLIMIPVCIPLLSLFNIYNGSILYLIPTHASIILLKASIETVPLLDLVYAFSYLIFFTLVTYRIALKAFSNHLSRLN